MSALGDATLSVAVRLLAQPSTPDPTLPASTVPDVDVTPGVWGFVAIAFVAVATVLIIVDMTRRVRRTRYRGEVRERIEAERADEAGSATDAPPRAPGDDASGGPVPRD
ncbi:MULTISPECIES: hypothetical protein [unclassified Frigoribacterium]|uniref:hypothetical protein n=1 Tax=unclassified Frigoribacterium TaxID=2627005 RepID=UPI0006FB5EFE|nr:MULTISPECIES: hypothetical protein [unclassified Frigoribacterium]KQO84153.1 hypothetical protein ASF17_00965 [Frigoribacterium sp. Leaf263]KQR66481.1 hypothetical protein ASF89_05230 [Frigoribacterium sp. Leaf172]